jgi:hypothetical protein
VEQLASNKITGIGYRLYSGNERSDGNIEAIGGGFQEKDSEFFIIKPGDNLTIPKGIPLWLEWNFTREGAVISHISLFWLYHQTNERFKIELGIPNHEYYLWNIPQDFTNYVEPTIIWEENESISILRPPKIKIIPNTETNEISASSFLSIETGYFKTPLEDASINILLEMRDDSGNISYTPDGKVWVNVKFNQVDSANPVSIAPDTSIFFPGTVDYKVIDLHIANSVNTDVFGIVNNLKIV